MLSLDQRIDVFSALGSDIGADLADPATSGFPELDEAVSLAFHKNGWFTRREVERALAYWAAALTRENLQAWTAAYSLGNSPGRIGLILAGNIPLVGFHDVLCTLLAGHVAMIKCSSSDDVLLPALLRRAALIPNALRDHFVLVAGKMSGFEAIIATGSNNSARYFESYFGKYPHIIRKNRTGIAVLTGAESDEELQGLMADVFCYYGLGCRNVTKLFLPEGFDLDKIFRASLSFAYLMENKKYANNYSYHKALMLMEKQAVLDNDLLLMTASGSLFSPVSVLHYEYYNSTDGLNATIEASLDHIQVVVGRGNRPFGSAQQPLLTDYADGVDTLHFLSKMN